MKRFPEFTGRLEKPLVTACRGAAEGPPEKEARCHLPGLKRAPPRREVRWQGLPISSVLPSVLHRRSGGKERNRQVEFKPEKNENQIL